MGGELGTRLANQLGNDPKVEAVLGLDIDPPRQKTAVDFTCTAPAA